MDSELANDFKICGVGYRAAFPTEDEDSVFEIMNLRPDCTFVVYSPDVYHRRLLAGTHTTYYNDKGLEMTYLRCYTDDSVYDLEANELNGDTLKLISKRPNVLGVVPVVEYVNDYQRMGCFERAIPLMDALNDVESDRCNGLAQTVQAFLWFDNVDLDDDQFVELKDKGAIGTTSKDGQTAHVEYIHTPLDQSNQQSLADDLYDKILRITMTPGREQSTGGNTGQAIMLGSSGWQIAEEAASKAEAIYKESDREMLKVILRCIHIMDTSMSDLNARDIEIKFARNKVSNLLTKTQGLMNMLTAGIHPQVAITNSDLFSDPQQVYQNSIPYLQKWMTNSDTTGTQLGSRSTTAKVVDDAEG
jgi:SPP1 family phage portal protein